ncbi:MAG: ABC transporter ATP-binding protein [Treponemataceae bacterium]|nr:ABC transporter ATP-binding protein [Treponemataceae bacterium]
MIQVDNVSKIYKVKNSKSEKETIAIDNISCKFCSGEITGLLGVNGAGKSTLLKMLSGNLVPSFIENSEGKIFINNKDLYDTNSNNLTLLKEKIGFVHEQPFFYEEETVKEVLTFATNICNQNKIEAKNNFEKILTQCNLTEVLNKKIKTLSKGYKQRLSFAVALSNNPEILLLDEPVSGLDPIQINEIRNLILSLKKNKTIILSTHLMQEIDALCDKIIILNKGKILAQGTEEEICKLHSCKNIEQAFLKLVSNQNGVENV